MQHVTQALKHPGTTLTIVTIDLEVTIIIGGPKHAWRSKAYARQHASLARATFGHTHDVSQSTNVSAGDLRVVLVLGLVANSWFFFIQHQLVTFCLGCHFELSVTVAIFQINKLDTSSNGIYTLQRPLGPQQRPRCAQDATASGLLVSKSHRSLGLGILLLHCTRKAKNT